MGAELSQELEQCMDDSESLEVKQLRLDGVINEKKDRGIITAELADTLKDINSNLVKLGSRIEAMEKSAIIEAVVEKK
jgi:hypothetical protein